MDFNFELKKTKLAYITVETKASNWTRAGPEPDP